MMPNKIGVNALRSAIHAHPELWDQRTERTASPASPHHGLNDIWVRFTPDLKEAECLWLAPARVLPAQPICEQLMEEYRALELGGVLITRIPAGRECKPHSDDGWHARKFEKFGVSIEADPDQLFCFEDETLSTVPGDVFWFDNAYTHWVTNPTAYDRITMIVCMRR